MRLIYWLLFVFGVSGGAYAETGLSSDKNVFPFKYQPAPDIELTLSKSNDSIHVMYPDKQLEEIATLDGINWTGNHNVTQDLNFDGFIDLALWVDVNPRGLNDSYDIFLWDHKAGKLKKVATLVNLSIEASTDSDIESGTKSGFLVENIIDTGCPDGEPLCDYVTRYQWQNHQLVLHSTLSPAEDQQTTIAFYKDGKVIQTSTVPNKQVNKVLKNKSLK